MAIQANNLFFSLLEKRNTLSTETDLLLFSKASKQAGINFVNVIGFFEDLPLASTQLVGSLWFVEHDNTLYFISTTGTYTALA